MAPLFFNEAQEISKLCKEKNILTSTFNNIINKEGLTNYIGQDLYQTGRVGAKLLDMLLHNGHIAIIHIDEMVQNATHMQQKEEGFKSYFEDNPSLNYKISTLSIDKNPQLDNYKSLEVYLNSHPDINGVFVTTSKTYFVAKFNKENTRNLKIVGYDLVEKNIKHLGEGAIDFLINQNPKKQAFLGLSLLAEHLLFDKIIPKKSLLPIDIINSENYKQYC